MADIQKPLRELIIDEAPKAISVTKETWSKVMNRPELRKLIDKFEATPSSSGHVVLSVQNEGDKASLKQILSSPPNHTSRAVPDEGVDFDTAGAQGIDLRTGLRDGTELGGVPAVRGSSEMTVAGPMAGKTIDAEASAAAPAGVGAPPPPAGMSGAKKGALAAGAAGLGAAGVYAASGSGGGEEQAAGQPAGATDSTPPSGEGKGIFQLGDTPAQPEEETREKHTYQQVSAEKISTPESFQKAIDEIGPAPTGKSELTDTDRQKWDTQRDELVRLYKESRRTNQWAEVAERIGQALTQFFAAKQGMAMGADMSGLKFEKTDWFRTQDQLIAELKEELGIVDRKQENQEKQIKSVKEAKTEWQRRRDAAVGNKARADLDTAKSNQDARLSAAKSNQSADLNAQGLDVQDRSIDVTAETRRDVAATTAANKPNPADKEAAKKLTALNKAGNIVSTMQSMSPKERKGALRQAASLAGEAGVTPADWQEMVEDAERESSVFGKSAHEILADKLVEYSQRFTPSAPQAPVGGGQAPAQAGGTPPAEPIGTKKEMNGFIYEKVQGGWKKVGPAPAK
jgi:hypothetical protein